MKSHQLAAATAIALATATMAHAVTPAYEFSAVTALSDSRPFTLGFEFSLSSPETVDALGYTTIGFTSDQQVGIWDSNGNLLTSATVSTSDPVTGHFAYAAISDITLGPGTYVIGGTFNGGLFPSYASGVTSIPGYTWITDEQIYGSGLNEPNNPTFGSYGDNGIPQVDFSVVGVPEPTAWALMLVGFGGLGAAMRASRRRTASAL